MYYARSQLVQNRDRCFDYRLGPCFIQTYESCAGSPFDLPNYHLWKPTKSLKDPEIQNKHELQQTREHNPLKLQKERTNFHSNRAKATREDRSDN